MIDKDAPKLRKTRALVIAALDQLSETRPASMQYSEEQSKLAVRLRNNLIEVKRDIDILLQE